MDRAERVLDRLAEMESSYFSLQKQLQDEVTLGLAELAQGKLTNSALESELKACNFRSPAPHCKALLSADRVEVVGTAPRLSEAFGISSSPNLHRAQSHFAAALRTACKLAQVQRDVSR